MIDADDRGPADFEWLDRDFILDLHQLSIEDFGGTYGIRDQGLLDSAINRPRHRWAYDEDPLTAADIAATYAVAIARNHAFVDGNKRTAFMAMLVFLNLNGWALDVWQWKATRIMEKVATGEVDEKELASWIKKHARPLKAEEEIELHDPDDEEDDHQE